MILLTALLLSVVSPLPSWALGGFVRPDGVNPVIRPKKTSLFDCPMRKEAVAWEAGAAFNPAATVREGKVVVLYRAEDESSVGIGTRTSRLGYAESGDGLHFRRRAAPVLFPAEDDQKELDWPGGCEDPRVSITADGTYLALYTSWNRKVPRLSAATSRDLIHWKKHGPVFSGPLRDRATKSASVITKIERGRQVMAKIDGLYWMYWGEDAVHIATSEDLVHWTTKLDSEGNPLRLIAPRKGFFDSQLTECGPPAVLTDKGIVLLYNGKNGPGGDARFTQNSYCAGQVLFSKDDPTKPIARLDVPFLRPMEPFEKSGQYVDGTVFVEGLVFFPSKWFLYYGCADSQVGVAIYDPAHPTPGDPIGEK